MVQSVDMELVYRSCFSKVYHYFFYRLLHRETAEDLTSRTFLRMNESTLASALQRTKEKLKRQMERDGLEDAV